jgi:hypothetical protein
MNNQQIITRLSDQKQFDESQLGELLRGRENCYLARGVRLLYKPLYREGSDWYVRYSCDDFSNLYDDMPLPPDKYTVAPKSHVEISKVREMVEKIWDYLKEENRAVVLRGEIDRIASQFFKERET